MSLDRRASVRPPNKVAGFVNGDSDPAYCGSPAATRGGVVLGLPFRPCRSARPVRGRTRWSAWFRKILSLGSVRGDEDRLRRPCVQLVAEETSVFVLERDLHLGSICLDDAAFDLKVELADFSDP